MIQVTFFISISVLKTVNFGNGAELKLNKLVTEFQVLELKILRKTNSFFLITRCRPLLLFLLKGIAHHFNLVFDREKFRCQIGQVQVHFISHYLHCKITDTN